MYVYVYVCMYVCKYVCMYVCMYVSVHTLYAYMRVAYVSMFSPGNVANVYAMKAQRGRRSKAPLVLNLDTR